MDASAELGRSTKVWKGGRVYTKGVGPSTTLAWPGWKEPDIPVEVDTAWLETSRTDTVKELPGYSVQNSPSGSFLSWGGPAGRGGIVWYCVNGIPQKDTRDWGTVLRTPVAFVSYRRLSSQFQFSLSAVTLVYLSQWFTPHIDMYDPLPGPSLCWALSHVWCREWSEESLRQMRVSLLPSAAYYDNKVLNNFLCFSPLPFWIPSS